MKGPGDKWRAQTSISASAGNQRFATALHCGYRTPGQNSLGAAHNHRQLSKPSLSCQVRQGGKRLGLRSWAAGTGHRSIERPIRRGMESRTAAQVINFKMFRTLGPPSKPKPRGHWPRSASRVSSYAGQRMIQTLNC